MKATLAVTLAAVLFGALPTEATAQPEDCRRKLRELQATKRKAEKLRARLRKMIIAGDSDPGALDRLQNALARQDARADELAAATRGCKRPRRRPKKARKKAPKEAPKKAAAPAAAPPPPAGPPPKVARVVLEPDRIAPTDPCADALRVAAATPIEREGRVARPRGPLAAWRERWTRSHYLRRHATRAREILAACHRSGFGGAP